MYLGTVVETGPTERAFAEPEHPYTAALLSAIPGETVREATGVGRERIGLRGSPPNPRDPPPGCPFATRCPAKVRPDDVEASEAVWGAVDEFRALLRERARRDVSPVATVARRLGLSADDSVGVAVDELFGDRELPPAVDEAVEAATGLAAAGRNRDAAAHLGGTLGSVCDEERPAEVDVGEDGRSRCVRSREGYDDAGAVLDRRFPGDE
jgi:peptide/nickel transport system ATP-binding protein